MDEPRAITELEQTPEDRAKWMSWQTEIFCPKMNALMKESWARLKEMGAPDDKLNSLVFTSFLEYTFALWHECAVDARDKDALMRICSDIHDLSVDAHLSNKGRN